MKSVEDLDVFKLAHQLALKTYSTTKVFPREETFSLVDQVQANCWDNDLNGAKRLNGLNDLNGLRSVSNFNGAQSSAAQTASS